MPSRPKIEYLEDVLRDLIRKDIKDRYGWECPDADIETDLGCENRWFSTLPDAPGKQSTD